MSPEDCSALLAEVAPGRFASEPRELQGGWSFHTFLCDALVVRIPRTSKDASLLSREFRLLPHLAPVLPVPIPRYAIADVRTPPRLGAYPYLAGIALTP
ncbi:MAG TPA: phosphotransferase, partial [Tepidiformaceae bacterium]|nr:phosphotransferase [Tepidiformaceae bacterium]